MNWDRISSGSNSGPDVRAAIKRKIARVVGLGESLQCAKKLSVEIIQTAGSYFVAKQLIERLRFSLTHLIVGIVERKHDTKLQLFPHPSEIGSFSGRDLGKDRIEQIIKGGQRLNDGARS